LATGPNWWLGHWTGILEIGLKNGGVKKFWRAAIVGSEKPQVNFLTPQFFNPLLDVAIARYLRAWSCSG